VNAPTDISKCGSAGTAPAEPLAISVRGVRKAYKIYDKPLSFLAEVITGQRAHREKEVLSNINIDVRRGEVVGIIGRNGAGKSTLLKMIAGTLAPSTGAIEVTGRVSAILELGTGFNPAYSGRDNVIMSALMRGMPEAEIRRKFDSIVAFAALEDVIDQPFHTYSSGMQARLAFAAAVAVDADVIIIDEALAAGDIRFTARSLRRVREICESGVTALFVSHQTYHVMQLCTRAIWIDEGRIRMDGDPLEVCRTYEYEMHEAVARDEGRMAKPRPSMPEQPSPSTSDAKSEQSPVTAYAGAVEPENCPEAGSVEQAALAVTRTTSSASADSEPPKFETNQYRIASVEFLDGGRRQTDKFRFGEPLILRVTYECLLEEIPSYSCGLAVAFTSVPEHQAVMYFNTNYPHSDRELMNYDEAPYRQFRGRRGVIEGRIPAVQLKPGEYLVSIGILPNRQDLHEFYEYRHMAYRAFVLPNGFPEPSVFYAQVEWHHGEQ
jgi:ABC-type polysaccharide/polyol phosphate transport system ATPase subunit